MDELSTDLQLYGERYKEDSESYKKFTSKLAKEMPTESMINELKKRKVLKINWITAQYDQAKSGT